MALHESGHLVAALLLQVTVTRATIAPAGQEAGRVGVQPEGVRASSWPTLWAAGMAAEILGLGGLQFEAARADVDRIRAAALVQGRNEAASVHEAIRAAEALLRPRWADVLAFQRALLAATTLDAAEIARKARVLQLQALEQPAARELRPKIPAGLVVRRFVDSRADVPAVFA